MSTDLLHIATHAGRLPQTEPIYEEWKQPVSNAISGCDEKTLVEHEIPSFPSFSRWRPLYHLQSTNGWMNDPCGPGYDPATGLYHMFFQWNPNRDKDGTVVWGPMHWGHASSRDMVHWTVSGNAALNPGPWYDHQGCFTGCFIPTGLKGQPGELTVFYTGVTKTPLHYTLPYFRQSETLAVAQSTDGGVTWKKDSANPILREPPWSLSVTGWRDPFVASWPAMDRLLGVTEPTLYGVISGGIRDKGPTLFLYTVDPKESTRWCYLSTLVDMPLNFRLSVWSGDMGINWECGNFVTLTSDVDGSSRDFILVGSEGSKAPHMDSTSSQDSQPETKSPRPERLLQWMSGKLHNDRSASGSITPKMSYDFGGQFDHGVLYALNSFYDPLSGQQIAWGWITEDDLPQKLVDRQGWSGMLSIPRELKLIVLQNVTGALKSELKAITSIEAEQSSTDTFTIRTLGIKPAEALRSLRQDTREVALEGPRGLSASDDCFLDVRTHRFELKVSFNVSDSCSTIGINIYHTKEQDEKLATTILLDPKTETLIVRRPDSREIDPAINTREDRAPFTLFSQKKSTGEQEREPFEIHVFFDESVLEAFANERTTITTRTYPPSKRCWGIRCWAEDSSQESRLLSAQAWDGLGADNTTVD